MFPEEHSGEVEEDMTEAVEFLDGEFLKSDED
jgi:hypothetical protein